MIAVKNFLKQILEKENYRKIIIIFGFLGVALIFFSGAIKENFNKRTEAKQESTPESYTKQLEADLNDIVSNISGAGQSKILVTLESGMENVYATEQRKNKEATEDKQDGQTSKKKETDDLETKYITIKDSDGSEKALSVMQIHPTIKGVVVVCAGGKNPDVKEKIINAVKTALNISAKKVFVTS